MSIPFPVHALQVDGGSEFKAQFEHTCADRTIPLLVLPSRSPMLNGLVESAHYCHNCEFYVRHDGPLTAESVNAALSGQEGYCNEKRLHSIMGAARDRWPERTLLRDSDSATTCGF